MAVTGIVTEWNENKGYGYISVNNQPIKIFFHISDFSGHSLRPQVSEHVIFSLTKDNSGNLRAVDIKRPIVFNFSIALAIWFATMVVGSIYLLNYPIIVIDYLLLISGFTYVLYAFDKSLSSSDNWQVPELVFHVFTLAGGWPGAVLAQSFLRHRPLSLSYLPTFWFTVIANVTLFAWSLSGPGREKLSEVVSWVFLL
ncbi:cold shock and DUF1294 domain-containing protein [Vibrio sp. S4M6]|uniref:DUF1294 domain-containing protein n=1 Tax=Vibrio sinus TaxID=2946865 RepID=UPI00202A1ABF|nr:cold shock and DUF1294 domain-containing protein [Vibrio sinus]MCL9780843.1 cold shock and DUF1294 domain-containing protein [Vibrio sinus]